MRDHVVHRDHVAVLRVDVVQVRLVRGWVAVNFFVPEDVMQRLADDESVTVRALVGWKSSLAEPIAV